MVCRPTAPAAMTKTKDLKSSPTLPLLHLHLSAAHRKRRSSLTAIASSAVAASIGRPFRSCSRRLARLFARLTRSLRRTAPRPATQSSKLGRRLGFHVAAAGHPALLPLHDPGCRTVFLDLDETLVHSSTDRPDPSPAGSWDFIVRPVIDGRTLTFYVRKRPGVDGFLASLAASPTRYEVVVFTAGLREYASLVLDRLDPGGTLFAHRLYRDACRESSGGRLTKDLSVVGRDLRRVVLVDDNPNSYVFQPENALPVTPFRDDPNDPELWRLRRFFDEVLPRFDDARDAVRWFRNQQDDSEGVGRAGAEEKKMATTGDDTVRTRAKSEEDDPLGLDITFTSRQRAHPTSQGLLLLSLSST